MGPEDTPNPPRLNARDGGNQYGYGYLLVTLRSGQTCQVCQVCQVWPTEATAKTGVYRCKPGAYPVEALG